MSFEPPIILELKKISVAYGATVASREVSMKVARGEIVALLGANGAGKTTILRAASGLVQPKAGEVWFNEKNINRVKACQRVKLGMAHCPEGRRIFPELTVLENLRLGAYSLTDSRQINANMEKALTYFPLLKQRLKQNGGTLSGGEQQMLAIGRALMCSPELLMLDEPSLGLAPLIIEQVFSIITRINKEEQVTILLVEQNANEALLHSNRAYVLETGAITISGPADMLRKDPRIIEAYLGG